MDKVTLLAGDCLEVLGQIPDQSVHCCITHPPYWAGPEAAGAGYNGFGVEPTVEQYVTTLVQVFRKLHRVLHNQGTVWLIIGETRKASQVNASIIEHLTSALQANGWLLQKEIVWLKPDKPDERDERILLFTKTERFYYNAEALPSNVLHVNREQPLPGYGFEALPEKLILSCLLAGSQPGNTILDPFCGSGSVGCVAIKHGRNFIGIELSPYYLEIARMRIQGAGQSVITLTLAPGRSTEHGSALGVKAAESAVPNSQILAPLALENTISITPSEVLPAECGCSGGGVKASANGSKSGSLVYAIGAIGYDFGTEARRDSLVQDGRISQDQAWNPSDPRQLLNNLEQQPWEAESLIWTLNQEETPIYAIQPAGPYASRAFELLRQFLRDQVEDGVERASIPGITAGSVRLLSGQTIPRIVPTVRGMYSWSTTALTTAVIGERPSTEAEQQQYDQRVSGIRNFLDRVYYELRNLGVTPQERAINYAATNAFQIAHVFEEAANETMQLDKIDVEKSPLCRPESECWDVKVIFFDPERQNQRARKVYRFTVDVSDEVPVTIGRMRSWYMY